MERRIQAISRFERGNILIIAIISLGVVLIVQSVLFFFLDRRQQAIARQLQATIQELQEKLPVVNENLQTLRANDDILAKDIEKLLHEFKGFEKKARQSRQG